MYIFLFNFLYYLDGVLRIKRHSPIVAAIILSVSSPSAQC